MKNIDPPQKYVIAQRDKFYHKTLKKCLYHKSEFIFLRLSMNKSQQNTKINNMG